MGMVAPAQDVGATANQNSTQIRRNQMTDKDLRDEGIEDSVEGKATELKGRVKDAAGGLTGDTGLQVEGKVDQLKGKAQNKLGEFERKIDKESDRP